MAGTIETIECREYKKTHPVVRRRGAKIITFTGDEEFLDSLHAFPSNFPFSIKIANAYIRGGDRVKERYAGGKPQRPRISQGALRDLLKRNSNSMADAAAEAEDRLADDLRRTDLHGKHIDPLIITMSLTILNFSQEGKPSNPADPAVLAPDLHNTAKNPAILTRLTFYIATATLACRDIEAALRPSSSSRTPSEGMVTSCTYRFYINQINVTNYCIVFTQFLLIQIIYIIIFIPGIKCKLTYLISITSKLYSVTMLAGHRT